jgi:hypothetical protein
MTFVTCEKLLGKAITQKEIGEWLEDNMPNPPLPDAQRWTLDFNANTEIGIKFADDNDALIFSLRWGI